MDFLFKSFSRSDADPTVITKKPLLSSLRHVLEFQVSTSVSIPGLYICEYESLTRLQQAASFPSWTWYKTVLKGHRSRPSVHCPCVLLTENATSSKAQPMTKTTQQSSEICYLRNAVMDQRRWDRHRRSDTWNPVWDFRSQTWVSLRKDFLTPGVAP